MAVILFAECCLEPVNGDRVLAAIHIEHIVLVVDLKDIEEPIIGTLQRTMRSIMADVHIADRSQGVRLVSQATTVVLVCRWQDRAHVVLKLAKEPRGCLHLPWLVREKLPKDTEGSAVYKICGRAAEVFRQDVLMPRSTSGSTSFNCGPWS